MMVVHHRVSPDTAGPQASKGQRDRVVAPRTSGRIGASGRFVRVISRMLPEHDLEALEEKYGSMEAVVKRLLTSLPNTNLLDEVVGPFRDTTNVRAFLDLTRQGVDRRVGAGTLLCVQSSDGHRMFPDFQFDASRQGLPHLREVLDAFDSDRKNAWDAALWLAQARPELDGQTPAAALRTLDAELVLTLAGRAGAVFAA